MNKSTIIWQLLPVCIRKDLKYCLVCFPDKTSLSPAPNAPQNSGSRTPSTPLTPSTQPGSLAGSVAQSTSNTNTCTTTTTGSRGLERSVTPDLTQEDLPPEFSFDPSVLDADRADGTRGLDVSWVCTTAIPPLPFTTDPPPHPPPLSNELSAYPSTTSFYISAVRVWTYYTLLFVKNGYIWPKFALFLCFSFTRKIWTNLGLRKKRKKCKPF